MREKQGTEQGTWNSSVGQLRYSFVSKRVGCAKKKMEPQRNLKETNNDLVYVRAEAVVSQPSAPDSNDHLMAMVSEMKNQAAADREAAAADRQAAAEERRIFEQNQRARQLNAVQTQQPNQSRNPQTQTTVVHVQQQGIDHCQHFVCCLFLGG